MAYNFEFYAPTKVIFGKDAEREVGRQAKAFGAASVLIVYGGGSVKRSGLLESVQSALELEGIAFCELGGAWFPIPGWIKCTRAFGLAGSGGWISCWPLAAEARLTRQRPSRMGWPSRSMTCGSCSRKPARQKNASRSPAY